MKFFKKQVDAPIPADTPWEIRIVPTGEGQVQSHYKGIQLPDVITLLKLIVYDYERLAETKKEE